MARALTGVMFLALVFTCFGCGSSSPMRFQFFMPGGQPGTVRVSNV